MVSLALHIEPPLLMLAPHSEAQLCYALVTIVTHSEQLLPVDWAIVADASRSMRIPIVSEVQFRMLVRQGGAQEVVVDGVPVWQLSGPLPHALRDRSPSALDFLARALHTVLERLDADDRFVLVACAEQVRTVASGHGDNRIPLLDGIARLKQLQLGDETDLALGMQSAIAALGPARDQRRARQLLVLTDGFTRDAQACLTLAQTAAQQGVSISTIGVGGDFQMELLTALADSSGGRAHFVRRAEEIPRAIAAEFALAHAVSASAVTLALETPAQVRVRRVTRISPSLAPLEWLQRTPQTYQLTLGDLERDRPLRLLLELLAPPGPPFAPDGRPTWRRLGVLRATSGTAQSETELIAEYAFAESVPPPAVLHAAAQASVVALQARALAALERGEHERAATLLGTVAARLDALGATELAAAARRQVASLAHQGTTSALGTKELTYATRRLTEYEIG
jgi:hypothetical protein